MDWQTIAGVSLVGVGLTAAGVVHYYEAQGARGRARAERVQLGILIGLTLVMVSLLAGAAGYAYHPAGHCQEDEAYAVIEDRNPAHGLTRACVAVDELATR